MKSVRVALLLVMAVFGTGALAQQANDEATQRAIIMALPAELTAETASADEIAQAAVDLAFGMDGNLEANLTQIMVSLGELTRAGKFRNAPRFGDRNPPGRFYTRVLNMASSNLDVASSTYYGLTVQDIIRLTAALRDGMNFLNDAQSNAITRK